ncbi:hypothetical protein QPK31_19235 [Massilia sp. YIM B02769]|uniref:hypothetical protein n=1 Tax=Massilia sp. YIM B02769 TaxID=3050129 RepID=UPI0025B63327|nr:hypothetical protein [Massilia sp. YIM B02769]MDN4060346.1 hypothetical protein [Massilia sp. YIM B02769]
MSVVLNDRDAILQAASVRIVNPKNAWINLTASAPGFHLNAAGQVDLAKVTVTADLVGLDDAVTFTAVGGTLSNAVGRSVDVTYDGQTAIVTAKVVSNGDEFQRALIIPVLRDGASGTGTPGARGAGHYYGSGTAWTDALANITVPTAKVVGDVVTISSGTFVMEKRWTGSAWVENGVVVDGKLIVPLSILAGSIDTRNLDIKDANGNIIFRAGLTMAEQAQINPNLVESFRSWINSGSSVTYDPAAAINGEAMLLPPNTFTQSRVLALEPNVDYIVSFRALSQQANTALSVDLFPDNLPEFTTGPLTASNKYFQFNMRSSAAQMAAATLRFLGSANGHILISDVKLERGSKATAWCDSVISQGNAGRMVMPGAIGNTQIGGDLFSTNWNGYTDSRGAGWLLRRDGTFYGYNVQLRGSVIGGDYTDIGWPTVAGKTGYALSSNGLLLGNPVDNRYFQIAGNGNVYAPWITSENGTTTIRGVVLINPDIQQAQLGMSGVPASINGGSSLPNDTAWRVYGSFTVTPTNVQGTATVTAFINVTEGEMRISQSGNTITVSGRGTGGAGGTSGRSNSGTVFIFVTDSNNRNATARVSAFANHGIIQ